MLTNSPKCHIRQKTKKINNLYNNILNPVELHLDTYTPLTSPYTQLTSNYLPFPKSGASHAHADVISELTFCYV